MNLGDLLTPWLMLAAVLLPLVYVEKWIHSHLYGVGWLLTDDHKSATALYYVLLFPGVFVHEFTQYLVAGALNVKIKKVIAWPEAQDDGTLRLDFVRFQKANRAQAAVIGAAPLVTGLALVWLISSQVLSLHTVVEAIGTSDLDIIGSALRDAASAPDFLLWLYAIFTISNAMLPTPADRQGWPLVIVAFAIMIAFLVLIGVGDVLMETFTGPVAHAVDRVTTAFATVLVAEVPGIMIIGFLEEVLERTTKRKFEYSRPRQERRRAERQPGSNLPLTSGVPLPSIYNLNLPVPTPAEVKAAPRTRRVPESVARPQPEPSPSFGVSPRPALQVTETGAARLEPEARPTPGGPPPATRPPGAPGGPSPSARPESGFQRRGPLSTEDQPAATEGRPPSRTPGAPGGPSPSARPESGSFQRRSPLTPEDEFDEEDERRPAADRFARPPSRTPGAPGGPSPSARPESGFQRRSPLTPEDESDEEDERRPAADRFARPQPARPGSISFEDDDDEEITYEEFDDVYDEEDE